MTIDPGGKSGACRAIADKEGEYCKKEGRFWVSKAACCISQETQIGVLYQPRGVEWGARWEEVRKRRGYMYTYGWFMVRLNRKQQNSVKQLSFNKK